MTGRIGLFDSSYSRFRRFFGPVHRLTSERRLSRIACLAEKPAR